jgi:hypothetical protein
MITVVSFSMYLGLGQSDLNILSCGFGTVSPKLEKFREVHHSKVDIWPSNDSGIWDIKHSIFVCQVLVEFLLIYIEIIKGDAPQLVACYPVPCELHNIL